MRKFLSMAIVMVTPLLADLAMIEEVAIKQTKKEFIVTISKDEGEVIEEIVTTLGKTSVVSLGFKKGHLKSLGKKLHGIGCLQFLGYIFSNPELKTHMKSIQKSSLKWDGFMGGLKPGFEKEAKSNKLFEDLPGFATSLQVDHDKLVAKAKEKDWDGFVVYLMENAK